MKWIRRCFSEPRICVGWPSSVRRCFCSKHAASAFTVARGLFEPRFFHTRVALAKHGRQLGWTRFRPARSLLSALVRRGCARVHTLGRRRPGPGELSAGYMVNLLWIQDMSLKDWLLSDHGHGNPGRYDLARSNSLDLTVTRGEPPVQPIGTWRRLGTYADYSLADVHWAASRKCARWPRSTRASTTGAAIFLMIILPLHLLPPTPLHTPTALPAFPPLPPVGLAYSSHPRNLWFTRQ